MELEEILMTRMSREQMNEAVTWVGQDQKRYQMLWDLVVRNEDPISRRAAWAMDIHFFKYPGMFPVSIQQILDVLEKPCHTAMQRHLIKLLSLLPHWSEKYQGALFDLGISSLNNPILPIAVRVHAMELAGRVGQQYPELLQELKTVLLAHVKEGSWGFKSRANKWLSLI